MFEIKFFKKTLPLTLTKLLLNKCHILFHSLVFKDSPAIKNPKSVSPFNFKNTPRNDGQKNCPTLS